MMSNDSETESLILRAGEGDGSALGHLLERHRQRLRRSIASRLERRLAVRIDPSDIVQEALTDAVRKLLSVSVREGATLSGQWVPPGRLRRESFERASWEG